MFAKICNRFTVWTDVINFALNSNFKGKLANTHLPARCFSSAAKETASWRQYFWKYCLAGIGIGTSVGTVASVALLYKFDHALFSLHRAAEAAKLDDKWDLRKQSDLIADIVEKTLPSVVHLERKNTPSVATDGKDKKRKYGSGFVINSDGLIITNAHVVVHGSHNGKIMVKLHDGRQFEGHVQMIHRIMDLATVKIDGAKDLPTLKFADSDTARPGEFVVAVGSPLSLNNTVTSGIISNTQRKLTKIDSRENHNDIEYIQTDASINSGNSGGPLVNSDCEIIGINTYIWKKAGVPVHGLSFAIPSNYCKEFLKKAHKSDSGGFSSSFVGKPINRKEWGVGVKFVLNWYHNIGMSFFALTDDVLLELRRQNVVKNLPKHGAIVHSIAPGSMAHLAGIENRDIITHINGQEVLTGDEITDALQNDKVNVLEFKLSRGGQPWTIKMEFDA